MQLTWREAAQTALFVAGMLALIYTAAESDREFKSMGDLAVKVAR